jgi:hypothetical protein
MIQVFHYTSEMEAGVNPQAPTRCRDSRQYSLYLARVHPNVPRR